MVLNNSINANASTPLSAVQGGTGLSSPTDHAVLLGSGAAAWVVVHSQGNLNAV